jgi:prevent-host-death family protein
MRSIAVFEAKNKFSELLTAVEHGEEITITRHGYPVARMVSASTPSQGEQGQRERVSSAMARLRALRHGSSLGCTLAEAIEDGRD